MVALSQQQLIELALQVGGAVIVLAAFLQVGVGLATEVNGALFRRRMDERRLKLVQAQTDILIKRAEVDLERNELTWSGKRKFRVVERRIENKAGDICSFYLAPHDGGALPPFQPGQFLTFELKIPDQSGPVVRCYSLSDSPMARDRYRVTIKKLPPPPTAGPEVPGGLSSSFFHNSVHEGDVLDVLAPNGSFHLDVNSDRPVVLIGGGVGLTPVLSMLKWLADNDSHRETWFFYAVRNSGDVALRNEIEGIIESRSHFHSVIVYSSPTEECVEGRDFDYRGFLSVDVMKRYLGASNYEFYICGPPPMMKSVTAALAEWGVPEEDIHFEAFGPASVKNVGKQDPAAVSGSKVEFARSGKSLIWSKEAGTLLELAEANGLRINSGCRAGNCGTCATAVKAGEVSYVTRPATKPAKGTALVCIACPDGDIVLDA